MSAWQPLSFQDGKVNGVTESTRILGYTFLHPSVVPRPHVQSVASKLWCNSLTLNPHQMYFLFRTKYQSLETMNLA